MPDVVRDFPPAARASAALLAAIGWAALVLQLVLALGNIPAGGTPAGTLANVLSYFTILTNGLLALTMSRIALGRLPSAWLLGAVTVYIAVVGLTYSAVLRSLWSPTGWQKVADVALHDLTPPLALMFWLAFAPKGRLRFGDVGLWLGYPLAYLAWSLGRGAMVGWYPYPFIDVGRLGYAAVALNAAVMTAGFLALGLALVGLDRLLGRNRRSAPPQP